MVAIEAIKFNHDTNAAITDGLNLRKNATLFINIPVKGQGFRSCCHALPKGLQLSPMSSVPLRSNRRLGLGQSLLWRMKSYYG